MTNVSRNVVNDVLPHPQAAVSAPTPALSFAAPQQRCAPHLLSVR
jgi:hypothetical protein